MFDKTDILDLHVQEHTVKNLTCDKSLNFNFSEAILSSDDFCKSNFDHFIKSDKYVASVRKASAEIVRAWSTCVSQKNGLVHYFGTTNDPRIFSYTIRFDFPGVLSSKIRTWSMTPAPHCDSPTPGSRGATTVTATGITIQCTRDAFQTVSVAVTADRGVAPPISLPGVNDAYLLLIGAADDAGTCWFNEVGKPAREIAQVNDHSADEEIYLTPQMSHGKRYELKCQVRDQIVGSDFNGCWSGHFELFKNGITEVNWNPSCCRSSACGRPPRVAWEETTVIDLDKEAYAARAAVGETAPAPPPARP